MGLVLQRRVFRFLFFLSHQFPRRAAAAPSLVMGPLLTTDYSPPTFFSEPGDRRDVFQYVSLRVLTLLHSKNGRNWAMAHKRSGNIPSVPGIRVFRGFTEKAAAGHSSDSRGAKRTANIEIARTAKFSAEDRHNPHP